MACKIGLEESIDNLNRKYIKLSEVKASKNIYDVSNSNGIKLVANNDTNLEPKWFSKAPQREPR